MDKPIGRRTSMLLTGLFYLFLCIAATKVGESFDREYWKNWAIHIFNYGLTNAYGESTNNYMPFIQYVLYAYTKFEGTIEGIEKHTYYLKFVSLAFDFLGCWFIYKFINKRIAFLSVLLICMLNIGYVYNSFVWNQYDGVLSTLNFIAAYYALKGKLTRSLIFYTIAFNMKVQAVVLLPVIGIFYLYNILNKRSWKAVVWPIVGVVITQVIFLIPFLFKEGGVGMVLNVITGSVGMYPKVSMNAFNIWYFLLPGKDLMQTLDTDIYIAGMTCKTVGLLLFFIVSAIALFPMLKQLLFKIKGKSEELIAADKLLLICGIIYLAFFFFNTQMHERYSHPAMIFFAAYGFYKKNYLLFIMFTFAYYLNMEYVLQWLHTPFIVRLTSAELVATLYAIILVYSMVLLYRNKTRRELSTP